MPPAQLLADLGNLAAHQPEFVATSCKTYDLRRRRVVLYRGDAVQLGRNVLQRSERRPAYDRRHQGGNHQRNQHERCGRSQAGLDVIQKECRRERYPLLAELLVPVAEWEVEFEYFRWFRQYFHLVQETTPHQLRQRCSPWQKRSGQIFVGRNQHHSVKIRDRNFVYQGIFFSGLELRAQSFADFKGMSHKIVDFLGSVRGRPQTLLARLQQRLLGLEKYLVGQVIRSFLGGLQELIERLRGNYSRQDRRDEQHQPRHH